jgi:cholest-4-en-3-one 26-monooxygenase
MTLAHLPHLDLLADAWVDEVPHDALDQLRREDPVHWHPETDGPGFWAVTRHADVVIVSRDTETYSSEIGSVFIDSQTDEALAQMRLSIIGMDGAKHNRYRRLVSKGFTPRVIARLEEQVVERAEAVVDSVCERGECEFVQEVAAQVPLQMICQMIGLPESDWDQMFHLSNKLVGFDDPELQATPEDGTEAAAEIYGYCDAIANDRRAHPQDDLMTALVQAEIDGDRLDDLELNLFFVTLVVAGNETTRNLINHSALALIEHPDQAKLLRAEPDLYPTAVEEMLRWGTSIHNFRRTATRDAELGGKQIKAGD